MPTATSTPACFARGDERRGGRARARLRPGVCTSAPNTRSPNGARSDVVRHTSSMPSGSARAPQHVERLREARVGHEELRRRRRCSIRLACTRCSIVIASAAAVASSSSDALATSIAGQVAHHRLEVEQRFEPALGDLGLIRRVRRVPAGVLEHVPQDDARRDASRSSPSPMNDLKTWFRVGGLRSSRRKSYSVSPSGRSSGFCRRMRAGIASSISASSDGAPTAFSIARLRLRRVRCGATGTVRSQRPWVDQTVRH